jgi:hypothetical protein
VSKNDELTGQTEQMLRLSADFYRLEEPFTPTDYFVVLVLSATAVLILTCLIHAFPSFGMMAETLQQFLP